MYTEKALIDRGGGVKCEKSHSLMSNLAISHLPARF